MTRAKRLLALAAVTALIGTGGVALAQSGGNAKQQAPQKAKPAKKAPEAGTMQWSDDCPNKGTGASSNIALDL